MLLSLTGPALRAQGNDYLGYPVDSRVRIYINWNSFVANGIPASWQSPFQNMVINAYSRWKMVAGFRLDPRFYGTTTRTEPNAGELIISMNELHHPSEDRIASRFGQPAKIVFHRKSGNGTPWNFIVHPVSIQDGGQVDMRAVLMHELGHAFGLSHESGPNTVMGSASWQSRYGPFSLDISDIRAQYGAETDNRVELARSTDSGLSWSNLSTNLTSFGISTTMDPSASRDPQRMVFFYTDHNKHPGWIIGSNTGTNFDASTWSVYGGLRSAYGVSGHGYDNEYMMAWVDDTN
ncbi:MAG: matrixin family metalloprotease, partial [Planctomycetes bacterium]|nr:matrixin family metalloprotease [Planctomycetota bacterium]